MRRDLASALVLAEQLFAVLDVGLGGADLSRAAIEPFSQVGKLAMDAVQSAEHGSADVGWGGGHGMAILG